MLEAIVIEIQIGRRSDFIVNFRTRLVMRSNQSNLQPTHRLVWSVLIANGVHVGDEDPDTSAKRKANYWIH